MENITSAISVQVDSYDKELASNILKKLGLNMSTFVNMAIKQLIYTNGLPFEVKNPKPSKALIESLKEGEKILNGEIAAKKYNSVKELIVDLENDI